MISIHISREGRILALGVCCGLGGYLLLPGGGWYRGRRRLCGVESDLEDALARGGEDGQQVELGLTYRGRHSETDRCSMGQASGRHHADHPEVSR